MRFRLLALFPLIYAVVFIVAAVALDGEPLSSFALGQRLVIRLLTLAGCLAAMLAFEHGDHMRRAWLWLSVSTLMILLRDLALLPPLSLSAADGGWPSVVVLGLSLLGNLALLTGIWLLARSWKLASLVLPGGRLGATAVTLFAALLALVVTGPSALDHLAELAQGQWGSFTLLVSTVADLLSFCLLAPLLLTALALHGGLFAWPWALVTASIAGWLLYDATAMLGPWLAPEGFPLNEVFRGFALNCLFAAGVAQRLVVTQVRQAAR